MLKFCKTSQTPMNILKLPTKIYHTDYELSRQPIGELIPSNKICNMDVEGCTIPFYQDENAYQPLPLYHKSFDTYQYHNFLNYARKNRCKVCGVNPSNAYYAPCLHGNICITCAMAYTACPHCKTPYSTVCRMTVSSQDVMDTRLSIAQPCGHITDTNAHKCTQCDCPTKSIDNVTLYE